LQGRGHIGDTFGRAGQRKRSGTDRSDLHDTEPLFHSPGSRLLAHWAESEIGHRLEAAEPQSRDRLRTGDVELHISPKVRRLEDVKRPKQDISGVRLAVDRPPNGIPLARERSLSTFPVVQKAEAELEYRTNSPPPLISKSSPLQGHRDGDRPGVFLFEGRVSKHGHLHCRLAIIRELQASIPHWNLADSPPIRVGNPVETADELDLEEMHQRLIDLAPKVVVASSADRSKRQHRIRVPTEGCRYDVLDARLLPYPEAEQTRLLDSGLTHRAESDAEGSGRKRNPCDTGDAQPPLSQCAARQRAATTILFDRMTAKEQLRSLVDALTEEEAATTLIVVERRRDDAMLQALAAAPLDDEESTDEEDRSASEAMAEYHRGETISSDQLKRELGLD